jgi:hypothetical protein
MGIQYNHVRKTQDKYSNLSLDEVAPRGGETIALEVPQNWLIEQLHKGDTITKLVGKARCSNSENYNKKTGRELATSRMKPTYLTVEYIIEGPKGFILSLSDKTGNQYILEKSNVEGANVRFVDYE